MRSLLILVVAFTSVVTSYAALNVIDLSLDFGPDDVPTFVDSPRYKLVPFFAGTLESGVYVEQNYFLASGNAGTHITAPSFSDRVSSLTIDKVSLKSMVVYGNMIDCTQEASEQRDYEAPIQKILDWEEKNGRISNNGAVIFNFGWSPFYENQNLYRGTYNLSDISTYVYPTVAVETARFLVEERNISIIATDALTVEALQRNGKVNDFPLLRLISSSNRLLVESLTNLDKLPSRDFLFSAAAVKYVGASAPQVRAYAILKEDQNCRCDTSPYRSPSRPFHRPLHYGKRGYTSYRGSN